jgi:valyl-tRNA synthetase
MYEKKIDVAAERKRLAKGTGADREKIANSTRQLGNEQFLAKTPGHSKSKACESAWRNCKYCGTRSGTALTN